MKWNRLIPVVPCNNLFVRFLFVVVAFFTFQTLRCIDNLSEFYCVVWFKLLYGIPLPWYNESIVRRKTARAMKTMQFIEIQWMSCAQFIVCCQCVCVLIHMTCVLPYLLHCMLRCHIVLHVDSLRIVYLFRSNWTFPEWHVITIVALSLQSVDNFCALMANTIRSRWLANHFFFCIYFSTAEQ